ncbi:hypothetical protein SESBI_33603 [Sesbania bispinosa]|nr:hypothetical protein SESBI_33603 [Sesbania bispinosa]
MLFPHATATALPAVSSDHTPILFDVEPEERSGSYFKYDAMWDDHVDCKIVIADGWKDSNANSSTWEKLLKKASNCKRDTVRWHKETFVNAAREIPKLKARLADLQNGHLSANAQQEMGVIRQKLQDLWKQEERYWGQRSRLKWLRWGDRNTKFFHATTIQRRGRNRLVRLKDAGGNWVQGQRDDALLFSKACPAEAHALTNILNTYSLASGQRINLAKSGLICGARMDPVLRLQMEGIFNINHWDNPGTKTLWVFLDLEQHPSRT